MQSFAACQMLAELLVYATVPDGLIIVLRSNN